MPKRDVLLAFETIHQWDDPETGASFRLGSAAFKAPFHATRTELLREADMLGASDVIVQVVAKQEVFYRDGSGIRSDRAHLVAHPGVVVRLIGTEHGDLRYATDRFTRWEANLRGIRLGLEALRKVDRYGIGTRGEQYRGWAELGAGTPMSAGARPAMTLEYGAAVLAGATDGLVSAPDVLRDVEDAKVAYRLAAKRYHPDAPGGSVDVWAQVDEAWQLVEKHHGGAA